jgi:hypothetical protein
MIMIMFCSFRLFFVGNFLFSCRALGRSSINEQRRFLKRPPVNTSQLKEGRRVGALAMKV